MALGLICVCIAYSWHDHGPKSRLRKKTTKNACWSMLISWIRHADKNETQKHELQTNLHIEFRWFVHSMSCYRFMELDPTSHNTGYHVHTWPSPWTAAQHVKMQQGQHHKVPTKLDIEFLWFVQRLSCYRFMDHRIMWFLCGKTTRSIVQVHHQREQAVWRHALLVYCWNGVRTMSWNCDGRPVCHFSLSKRWNHPTFYAE